MRDENKENQQLGNIVQQIFKTHHPKALQLVGRIHNYFEPGQFKACSVYEGQHFRTLRETRHF